MVEKAVYRILSTLSIFALMIISFQVSAEDHAGTRVSEVMSRDITYNSTRITWITDIPSDSLVEISEELPFSVILGEFHGTLEMTHSVNIWDLSPDQIYYFRVTSVDGEGNSTTDDNGGSYYQFSTSTSEPPSITNTASTGPTTGDRYNFTVVVDDDWGVIYLSVEYSIDEGAPENVSMVEWYLGWFHEISIPDDAYQLEYTFHCLDVEGNSISQMAVEPVLDDDSPIIDSVVVDNVTTGDLIEINASISDNIGVVEAYVKTWYGTGYFFRNSSMTEGPPGHWTYHHTARTEPSRSLHMKVTAVDQEMNWFETKTLTFDIIDNDPPKAEAGSHISIDNGETVTFNGSSSYDNTLVTGYHWNFTYNGTEHSFDTEGFNFTFHTPGIYEVSLEVEDEMGLRDTNGLFVTVNDTIPPTPIVDGILSAHAGYHIHLDASNSTDNGDVVRYIWTFRDLEERTVDGDTLFYLFTRRGLINITLTVIDSADLATSIHLFVEIIDSDDPIAVAGEDLIIALGTQILLNGSGSSDDGVIKIFYWSFMDGEQDNEFYDEVFYYTFKEAGDHEILLTVFDQSGNFGSDTIMVSVKNTGTLNGRIRNSDGDPISGARIEVIQEDGTELLTSTGPEGYFTLEVTKGRFSWKVSADGHSTASGDDIMSALEVLSLKEEETELEEDFDWKRIWFLAGALLILIGSFVLISTVFKYIKKKKGSEEEEVKEKIAKKDEGPKQNRAPLPDAFDMPDIRDDDVELFTADPREEASISDPGRSMVEDLFEE